MQAKQSEQLFGLVPVGLTVGTGVALATTVPILFPSV